MNCRVRKYIKFRRVFANHDVCILTVAFVTSIDTLNNNYNN